MGYVHPRTGPPLDASPPDLPPGGPPAPTRARGEPFSSILAPTIARTAAAEGETGGQESASGERETTSRQTGAPADGAVAIAPGAPPVPVTTPTAGAALAPAPLPAAGTEPAGSLTGAAALAAFATEGAPEAAGTAARAGGRAPQAAGTAARAAEPAGIAGAATMPLPTATAAGGAPAPLPAGEAVGLTGEGAAALAAEVTLAGPAASEPPAAGLQTAPTPPTSGLFDPSAAATGDLGVAGPRSAAPGAPSLAPGAPGFTEASFAPANPTAAPASEVPAAPAETPAGGAAAANAPGPDPRAPHAAEPAPSPVGDAAPARPASPTATSTDRSLPQPAAEPDVWQPVDAERTRPADASESSATPAARLDAKGGEAEAAPRAPALGPAVSHRGGVEAPSAATGPGAASRPPAPAAALEQTIRLAQDHGFTHARITLRPAELGGLDVLLRTSAEGITATVVAEGHDAARMLQEGAGDLRRRLEAQGVQVLALDVSTAQERAADADRGWRPSGPARPSTGAGGGPEAAEPRATRTIALGGGVLIDVFA